jgi:hypothetical protein
VTPTRRTGHRSALASAAATATVFAAAVAGISATAPTAQAAPTAPNAACQVLFDDFSYNSPSDPALTTQGWTVRTGGGGPGPTGATWTAANVSFPTIDGTTVLQMTAATNGTTTGTTQSEINQNRNFYEGTYATRIKFADTPTTGNDGDNVLQTFFTITPLDTPMDPNYGEIDFEYLPNGGWGEPNSSMFYTTWETYQAEPWNPINTHDVSRHTFAGWHDLIAQVTGGHVKYYIDGNLVADHSGIYYPETPMSINFNTWFIDLANHTGPTATYTQQIDYVLHTANNILTPSQISNYVNNYRSTGTRRTNTMNNTSGNCTPPTNPAELAPGFRLCAAEAGSCSFTGTRVVGYGAGSYVYKAVTSSTACTSAAFGSDPAPNVLKSCYLAPLGGPVGYQQCSAEGGTCMASGHAYNLAYGANGAFNYRVVSGNTTCTSAVLGDPLPGVAKNCYLAAAGAPATGWSQCAAESGTCASTSGQPVAYGAYGAFTYTTATGPMTCNSTSFGDPIGGVAKACYVRTGPPFTDNTTACATETGTCAFTGAKTVAYGANGHYLYKTFTGNTTCTAATFGSDPMYGVPKSCYLTPAP